MARRRNLLSSGVDLSSLFPWPWRPSRSQRGRRPRLGYLLPASARICPACAATFFQPAEYADLITLDKCNSRDSQRGAAGATGEQLLTCAEPAPKPTVACVCCKKVTFNSDTPSVGSTWEHSRRRPGSQTLRARRGFAGPIGLTLRDPCQHTASGASIVDRLNVNRKCEIMTGSPSTCSKWGATCAHGRVVQDSRTGGKEA